MASISGVGSSWASSTQIQGARPPKPTAEQMFQKIDSDGSGGVDATELQTVLSKVAEKSGVSSGVDAQELLTQSDANSDGHLSSDELEQAMQTLRPPTSTMEFAQSRHMGRSAGQGDDLFGKVDADSSGGLSETELQSLMDKMGTAGGAEEAPSASDRLAALDTDGNGELSESEFEAGRPQGGPQGMAGGPQGMEGPQGMPPPRSGGVSSAGSSTNIDPMDTNEDGVVSAQERAAAAAQAEESALQSLFETVDTDGNGQINKAEVSDFIQQLADQYTEMAGGSFGNNTGSTVNTLA